MIRPFLKSLLIILFTSMGLSCFGQNPQVKIKEIGTPFINTYTTADHGAHAQVFQTTQSESGILYFGSVSGILEFDGQTWSIDGKISDDAIKDLDAGSGNRIYAVTKSDFGYLYPDAQGSLVFRSIKEKAPASFNVNGSLDRVDVLEGKVAFKSLEGILLYDIQGDTTSLISPNIGFGHSRRIGDDYFVFEGERGLLRLKGDSLVSVTGAEWLKGVFIKRFLRYGEDELLILSGENSLFRFDFRSLTPFETEVSEFLKGALVYSAVSINDQYFAFGTDRSGIVIIDKEGTLVQKLDKTNGLFDGFVAGLFVDKEGDLWAAQHGAISHIVLNSAVTTLDERHGLNGYLNNIAKHKNITYVSSMKGVFYKEDATPWQKVGEHKPFQLLEGQSEISWKFIEAGEDFFVVGDRGLVQIDGKHTKAIFEREGAWASAVFDKGNTMILGGVNGGLSLVTKEKGLWKDKGRIAGFGSQVDFLERAEDGQLWLTDSGSGAFKLALNAAKDSVLSIRSYGPEDGLPQAQRNRVFRHSSGLIFTTAEGIYTFNMKTDRFEPNEELNALIGKDYVFRLAEIGNGDFYVSLDPKGSARLRKREKGYDLDFSPFNRMAKHNPEYVFNTNKGVWIAGSGVKHYDPMFPSKHSNDFQAHVRSVKVSNKGDSLVFGGVGVGNDVNLSPSENALYFSYAATFYDDLSQLEFQSYLEGSEEDWSVWSTKADRNYTNLPHGTYTFKVRSRNVYGELSEVDNFTFTIITPWYLTLWAFLLYAILAVLMVWGIVKFYIRRLENEKLQLESIVEERTRLIREQKDSAEKDKELIQQQTDRLKELDKVKSRFFANISHELRTPLTLINAPLESLLENGLVENEQVLQTLETARKNGVNLLSLVEEILDLAKLDAGKLQLIENPLRLYECLMDTAKGYTSGFQKKQISFEFDYQLSKEWTLLMDESKFRKVLNNLLSNALKFTPEKGEISLFVGLKPNDANGIVLHISDTGSGIHPEDLPYIFDRYYQSEQPGKKAEGGTGIGLALARELAELLGGNLVAVSELGKGSTFTIELPAREVNPEEVISIKLPQGDSLVLALNKTIADYSRKFEVDRPVLLITEDHPEMRAFIASTLEPYFEIKEADNGKSALAVLNSSTIDIVISDVMMPEMDGFELLKAIKAEEHLRQVSVVMLTARADQEDKLEALTLGIDDYLTKPFSAAEFLARIKNILENRIKVIRELKQLNITDQKEAEANLQAWIEEYGLSEREVDVMTLLAKRYTNLEIADKLCVSLNTVKFHLKNLYLKLGISSRTAALSLIEDLPDH